ncbi:MAG: ABC transporter permease [Candidatus Methanoperedens sp.]|nr:ABC transporter permease [Candidatus Methanoperedens sp.]PKL54201.1 MAG: ABC transporter permease [Candidatus Methanoperedenaceae archaeon HGW-Methanoperedenaceae-1]
MGNTSIIVRKEVSSLLNEKTLILAIIIQLLIASLSSLLVLGLASFFDPSALGKYDTPNSDIGIVGEGEINRFIEKSDARVFHYMDLSVALDDFYAHKIDAVLVVPQVKSGDAGIIRFTLYLPDSDIRGTLATLQLKAPLEAYEAYVRDVRGTRIGFEPVRLYVGDMPKKTSTYFEFIYGVLIPLLVFTPVFISGGLIIDMLTEEYERKTMELLMVTPVSFSEIVNGKMITAIVIVPAQVLLWLVLVGINGVSVHNTWIILLMVSIIAAIIVLTGAIVAVRFKKRVISQYLYSQILILMFLVAYLFPDSPFNLAAGLSAGSIGISSLLYCGAYAVLLLPLYVYLKKTSAS